jgi:hypothetical protein
MGIVYEAIRAINAGEIAEAEITREWETEAVMVSLRKEVSHHTIDVPGQDDA